MAARNPLAAITPIDDGARIHAWGDVWRLVRTSAKGHKLKKVHDPDVTMLVTHTVYNAEALTSTFRREDDYFRPRSVVERARKHPISISHLPLKDQNDIEFKIECITEYYKLYYNKKISRTADGFKRAAELISATLGLLKQKPNRNVNDPSPPPKKRGCRNNFDAALNGSTLQSWIEKLEAADWDFVELRDGRNRSGNHNGRFSPETYTLLEDYAHQYCRPHCPNRRNVYDDFKVAFNALNNRFRDEGRPLDHLPSFSRFCLEIAKLDDWEVDYARLGHEAAHRKRKLIGAGLDVHYALERVEMDYYNVDLHLLLVDTEVWKHLSPKLRIQIERNRWYLCVAIDVASRCILGMKLARSESSQVALDTLRMVFYDKTGIGRAAGALSPWDQCGPPWMLTTDQGSAFVKSWFQFRAVSLLADVFNPPAAQPQLRAFIERFFRTVLEGLLKRFEGNTGGSIAALGDYPAQLRAVLTVEQFSHLLVRWCVDIYHHKKHAGLGGETPRDAWVRLTKLLPPMPAPDPCRMRISFGIDLKRPTRMTGIRVLGLDYSSEELQAWCRRKGDTEAEVKVDPYNLGAISVRLDPDSVGFITVPCRTRFMEGRRLDDWIQASEELSRRYEDVAQMRLPIILKTIEEIQRTHRRAVEIADLKGIEYDCDRIEHYEGKLSIGFAVPASEDFPGLASVMPTALPSQSSRTGTLPSTFALPGSLSFAVGASRVVAGSSSVPALRPTSAADVPAADLPTGSTPIPPCVPDRSAAPEAEEARSAPVPDATEPAGPRRRRTTVKLEK
ncbi:DDE-type integrase/transposase/recombinase [Methylobacterium haplocladii]|uniref:Integrase catalytic domain-containing protein n=1 Tax=Methylobacterium haplocladii TaxID=1176176 RepID=A0A512IVI6_9HYPH|nr:DDE-type integrase/transposase/recombinase [Methylobacterium haplocladii]GEP01727.1 hypothetical protein MHA02_41140 [Methylobacterium haplocladii]GJD85324.1 hypothetical protein HPGCJGGD_3212 [Methylobacterium haplocladii]GLS59393.1 hypothetical protein GCM10007887_20590 [Methylobacterium haplocladii]